jgi:hypothetical protein
MTPLHVASSPRAFPVWPLPLLVGVWPVLLVHGCLWLSINAGLTSSYPLWDGRYSVSAVARQLPTLYWFRMAIMPYAVLLALFWLYQVLWLHHAHGLSRLRAFLIGGCGVAAAGFLLLYASFLGTEGELYTWLRRFGATLWFALTALAQLCCLPALRRHAQAIPAHSRSVQSMKALSVILLLIGLSSLALPYLVVELDAWQNRVEWWFGALMMAWFLPLVVCWRRGGHAVQAVIPAGPKR